LGQRRVGVAAAVVDAAALVGVVVVVLGGAAPAVAGLVAALAGFANPQIGPLVRVRWAHLFGDGSGPRSLDGRSGSMRSHRGPATLSTAFSYEGAADELSYMAGPALVGLLALAGPSALPLLVAAALTVSAAVPFALHPTATPARGELPAGRTRDRLPVGAVTVLVAAMAMIGVLFGSVQTGVTAFAEESGMPGAAGLIYAVLGVGSAIAGLATAWLPASLSLRARYTGSAVALAAGGLAVALLGGSLPGVLAAMALVGVTSAPYLIAVNGLASAVSPVRRAGAVMTLVAAGVVGGVALGAAIAGRLADAFGYAGAFAVPAFAGLAGLLLALVSARVFTRALTPPAPTATPAVAGTPAPQLLR
ncbi:MAG: MFS transporter, partial [Hamadaea sp.]|nr:MFS transporter [Hamadaea sp.]